jgi:hypothetical protein
MDELRQLYQEWKNNLDQSLTDPTQSEKAIGILELVVTAMNACRFVSLGKKSAINFSYWDSEKREQRDYHVYVWGEGSGLAKCEKTRSCRSVFDCECQEVLPKYGFVDSKFPEATFELYAVRRVKEAIQDVAQGKEWWYRNLGYPSFCNESTDDKERRGKCPLGYVDDEDNSLDP